MQLAPALFLRQSKNILFSMEPLVMDIVRKQNIEKNQTVQDCLSYTGKMAGHKKTKFRSLTEEL